MLSSKSTNYWFQKRRIFIFKNIFFSNTFMRDLMMNMLQEFWSVQLRIVHESIPNIHCCRIQKVMILQLPGRFKYIYHYSIVTLEEPLVPFTQFPSLPWTIPDVILISFTCFVESVPFDDLTQYLRVYVEQVNITIFIFAILGRILRPFKQKRNYQLRVKMYHLLSTQVLSCLIFHLVSGAKLRCLPFWYALWTLWNATMQRQAQRGKSCYYRKNAVQFNRLSLKWK